jgi:hypothetical protein
VELKKFKTTHEPRRRESKNASPSYVVLVISGAGFNINGVAAVSALSFEETAKMTMKNTITAATATEIIGAIRRGACSDMFIRC